MRWLDVSDAFGTAHDAVETYLYTRVEVDRLVEFADPAQTDRLLRQLADEERLAVLTVDKATEELWHVRSELPERAEAVPVPPPVPPVMPPPVPARVPSQAEDFMNRPHVETVLTTYAIAARYPSWQRHR
jgi:hypothetical protein